MIKGKNLIGGYTNSPIINGLDFEIEKGEFFALLGPNGSGKTTLFKLMTGQLPMTSGEILLSGKNIGSLSKLEKAKKIAVLTQEAQVSFDYTAEEIVSLGRYPHQKGILKQLSSHDWHVIEDVMELTKVSDFRNTPFRMMSGGEKQRVLLAKALAQEPEILLLDEPTNHLDIKHTFQILDLLKERQQTKGLTIFSILHDLNVASLYADRVALLHQGRFLAVGEVDTLEKTEQLKKVYEVEVKSQPHPVIAKPQLLMTPGHADTSNPSSFEHSYRLRQNNEWLHVQFDQALRTISNGIIGDGIQWAKHFCHFHVPKKDHTEDPEKDVKKRMTENEIPHEQAVAMMTAGPLEHTVVKKQIEGVQMLVIVTAEGENGVDITNRVPIERSKASGSMNTMVFIDAHFSDSALVHGYMSATEAKVKAFQDLGIKDAQSQTTATGTSTDSLLIALTQQGEKTNGAGAGTMVGKEMGALVYEATKEAIGTYAWVSS